MNQIKLLFIPLFFSSCIMYGQNFNMGQFYPIESSHSYVSFVITYMGYARVRGNFADFSGTFRYDPNNPSSTSVSFSVDVNSIDTNNDWRDGDLKSEGWFHAEQYPSILFQSTSAVAKGTGIEVTGKLTIRDVTKEIKLSLMKPTKIEDLRGDQQVIFSGTYTLNRKEYNVLGKRWDQVKEGIVALSDEVEIEFSLLGKQILKDNFKNWLRNPDSHQHKIHKAYEDGGTKTAIKVFEKLMSEDTALNSSALNTAAYMVLLNGQAKDAIKLFEKNLEVFPDNANNYDSMGEAYATAGELKKAKASYQKSLELDPSNLNAKEILRHLD